MSSSASFKDLCFSLKVVALVDYFIRPNKKNQRVLDNATENFTQGRHTFFFWKNMYFLCILKCI